jgi:hypothetical protein
LKKLLIPAFVAALALAGSLTAAPAPKYGSSNQSIGDEELEAKDPLMATVFSIIPGIVFHGSGNFYAGDTAFGSKMLVMELFGVGLALWGHNLIHQPGNWEPYFGGDSQQAGYWIKAAGVGLVVLSWIGDVATAPGAAEQWNSDHQIQLQMDSYEGTGARLMLATRF